MEDRPEWKRESEIAGRASRVGEKEGRRKWRTAGRNFVSFVLLHLKAVIYARVEVKRNATEQRRERARGGSARGPEESGKRRTRKRNKRRYCNRYVSMQTLSFIRLPVYGSGGDVSGVCAGVRGTRVTVVSDRRGPSGRKFVLSNRGASSRRTSERRYRTTTAVTSATTTSKRRGWESASRRCVPRIVDAAAGRREDFRENARNQRTSKLEINARRIRPWGPAR